LDFIKENLTGNSGMQMYRHKADTYAGNWYVWAFNKIF
jgi:hypothetical protein